MSKDSDDCEIMNELFGGTSKRRTDDDDLPYYNHWRPVAIVHSDGENIGFKFFQAFYTNDMATVYSAIDEKMKINRSRFWEYKNGVYHHTEGK